MARAAFRGVEFHLDSVALAGGRRNVVHEYPQRDDAVIEDLGRKTLVPTMAAFVTGHDWRARRDALIAALEQGGPGSLEHPSYGSLQVNVDTWSATEQVAAGRVDFALSFVRSGLSIYPTTEQATDAAVLASSSAASSLAAARLAAAHSVAGLPASVLSAAAADVAAACDAVDAAVSSVSDPVEADALALLRDVASIRVDAANLAGTPAQLAARFGAIFASLQGNVAALLRIASQYAGVAVPVTANTVAEAAVQANREATNRFFAVAALAAAAAGVAATTFRAYDDAVAMRDALTGQMNAEADLAVDDAVYGAIVDMRVDLVDDVDERAADLARVVTRHVDGVASVLELASQLYDDIGRADEIADRNDIPHPGFAAGELLVLGE
jgi:prophage DNA circulation protein